MKIDLFDIQEFIDINHLQEIKSPVLFQRGDVPHPDGLVSNEIFGVTTKSRKETFAYINLYGYFFHPHIYKAIKRMFRNIDKIVNGESYYVIDQNGELKLDNENGETGIEFLYNNWDKIKWLPKANSTGVGMRDERIELLKNYKKNEVFMHYQIVIPAFYRDIKSSQNGGETDDINNMYSKLIRLATLIRDQDMFDFQFHSTNFNIQMTLIEIYDYFKHKIEKKQGLIRKYLMGKNCDYCTRTVITAPVFHANRPEDLFTDFRYTSIPISQACSLCYPFVFRYVKDFFEREVIDSKTSKILYNPATDEIESAVEIVNPESYFSDRYIKKMIDTFIKDPESRFTKIEVPTNGKKVLYLSFSGKRMDISSTSELSEITNRPMTWTDLLYLACEKVTRDKHCLITRYPLLDEFGVFISRIRISSTTKTTPMIINGELYKWYPDIDIYTPSSKIAVTFIDSCQFSNSYLPGIEGDYDGDQTTVKIIFTQEANEECEVVINKKSYFINSSGGNIRKVGKEALQTFYVLTKEPYGIGRPLTKEESDYFIKLDPKEITFEKLVEWFGNTADVRNGNKKKQANKSQFNPTDTLTIKAVDYKLIKGEPLVRTTLGRLIFNKVMIENLGFDSIFNYQNEVLLAGKYGGFDGTVAAALKDDKITVDQMYRYIDTRDWFGLQLHGVITSSFTMGVIKTPQEIRKMKQDLFKEHKKELDNGDERVMEQIEKQLINRTKEILKDDIGMDLYNSGARGSVNNHLKNINLTRGAVKNNATGKYDIIENSLLDGLAKKDIPAHSNTIVGGAYPKAVGTQVSGYLAKELLSALQTEVLADPDSDCGSLRTLSITLTKANAKDFLYRYIKEGSKYVCLDSDTMPKYIGKTVQMRSPMYCIGVGKEKHLCNKCCGDFYYKLGKRNIGLAGSKVSTSLTQLNLQKFHENLVKTRQIDVSDMLI